MNGSLAPLTAKPVGLQAKPFAARYLDVSMKTLDRLVAADKLKCVRPTPGTVRFRVEDLDAFIESLAAASK